MAQGLERKVEGLASNLAKVVEQLGKIHAGSGPPGSGAKPPAHAAADAGAEPGPPKDDAYKEAQAKVNKWDSYLKKAQELDMGADEEARAKDKLAAARRERDALKTPGAMFHAAKRNVERCEKEVDNLGKEMEAQQKAMEKLTEEFRETQAKQLAANEELVLLKAKYQECAAQQYAAAGGGAATTGEASTAAAAGVGAEQLDAEFAKYLEQADPETRDQFKQNFQGFTAWRQKAAEEEAAAKAKAEEQAREAAAKDKAGDVDMGSPGKGTKAKRSMQQEDIEGVATKLEEAIKAENLSPDDVEAMLDATRRRLNKKLRLG